MDENVERECAVQPEDLSPLIFERLNAADVDGLVALYEPNAVLALPGGQVATGADEIRKVYEQLVADRPTFSPGVQRPTLCRSGPHVVSLGQRRGHRRSTRRQLDGTWLWVLDRPNVLE